MNAEVCAYLTVKKYFELPSYRVSEHISLCCEIVLLFSFSQKSMVNFTTIFCVVVFIGMCLVGVGVVTHSDWQ